MEKVTLKEVKHLASLSALEFSETELNSFLAEFNNTLDMINKIENAELDQEFKYTNVVDSDDLREDIVEESMPQELSLINAPKKRKGCYNVPKVVD